jgi:integrase
LRETAEISEPRKVFHSFRHTFKTALRNFCDDQEIRNAITGHETEGEGANYGGKALAALTAAMASLPSDPLAWQLDR